MQHATSPHSLRGASAIRQDLPSSNSSVVQLAASAVRLQTLDVVETAASQLALKTNEVDDAFALDILANLAAGGDAKASQALKPFLVSESRQQEYKGLVKQLSATGVRNGSRAMDAPPLTKHGEMTDVQDLLCAASTLRNIAVCGASASDAKAIAIQIRGMGNGTNALILHVNRHFMTCIVQKSGKAMQVHLVDTNAVDEQDDADESSKNAARLTRQKATDLLQSAGVDAGHLSVHAAPLQTHAPNACGPLSLGLLKHLAASAGDPSSDFIGRGVAQFFQEVRGLSAEGVRLRTTGWREEMAQARDLAEAEARLPSAQA